MMILIKMMWSDFLCSSVALSVAILLGQNTNTTNPCYWTGNQIRPHIFFLLKTYEQGVWPHSICKMSENRQMIIESKKYDWILSILNYLEKATWKAVFFQRQHLSKFCKLKVLSEPFTTSTRVLSNFLSLDTVQKLY